MELKFWEAVAREQFQDNYVEWTGLCAQRGVYSVVCSGCWEAGSQPGKKLKNLFETFLK